MIISFHTPLFKEGVREKTEFPHTKLFFVSVKQLMPDTTKCLQTIMQDSKDTESGNPEAKDKILLLY